MIPHIPWPLSLVILVANATIPFVIWRVFSAGASRRISIAIAAFVFGWFGLSLLLAPAPESLLARDRFYLTPLIPLFAIVPFAIVAAAVLLLPAARAAVRRVPLPSVVAIQFYRAVGVVFIILYSLGQLPRHFALPAGWGDIFVGLTAPIVALALSRRLPGSRGAALAWSVFGLVDLAVAVGMGTGFLAPYLAPSLGAHVPPAAGMGVYPLILIPTFAVPLSVILHVIAIGRLVGDGKTAVLWGRRAGGQARGRAGEQLSR
jgi:hypothetical protein